MTPDSRPAHEGVDALDGTDSLDSIDTAIAQIRAGRPIIVVDDEDRENEGDLVMAAELATPEWVGFIVRHTSGVICTPLTAERARALALPPMTAHNEDPKGTAYTVSCDAVDGTSTGISAADRARTARVLAAPHPDATALSRPGHIFPLIAKDGGVRERPGHTEAGVEFSRLAGLQPVSVIAEMVHDDGSLMRLPALLGFGAVHELAVVSIADLIAWLERHDTTLPEAVAGEPVVLPTPYGRFRVRAWTVDGVEHLTIEADGPGAGQAAGDRHAPPGPAAAASALATGASAPVVRLHSECLTGDVFGSHRCDCGEQLQVALRRIAADGGVVVYLRDHEGRGIGLANKLAAYALQDKGADTVDANRVLGFADDARSYEAAAAVLHELGLSRVRLMTNNPAKVTALEALGVSVESREAIEVPVRAENARYMETKRVRMHHVLSDSASTSDERKVG